LHRSLHPEVAAKLMELAEAESKLVKMRAAQAKEMATARANLRNQKKLVEELAEELASGKFQKSIDWDPETDTAYRRCKQHRAELFEERWNLSPRSGLWCPIGHAPADKDIEVVVRRTNAVEYSGENPT
jgi:hypothetical protein